MGILYLGKARESLTLTAESYKALVLKYLEQTGYSLTTDSYTEGTLPDMILVNPSISLEKEFWVECKATSIGPNDKKFTEGLLNYFINWLRQKKNAKLLVFARELKDKKEFEKLFGTKYSIKYLKKWYELHSKNLPDDQKSRLKDVDFKDVAAFFSEMDVHEADPLSLDRIISEKAKRSNLSLQRYAENLLKQSQRMEKPFKKKNRLVSNLVKMEMPDKYYVGMTKHKKKQAIYDLFNKKKTEIPPFVFYPEKKQISSFCPFDENNPLSEIIVDKSSAVKIADAPPQFVNGLVNQHLRRILWKKGLTRISETNIFYFETDQSDGEPSNKVVNGKTVATVYRKEDATGKERLNYVFHHAAEIRPRSFWGKQYVQIIPARVYTTDGHALIEGRQKDTLDRFFRNPQYNRNPSKILLLSFWAKLLRDSNYVKTPEDWFSSFKFKDTESVDFDWTPKPVEGNQAQLEEF